MLKAVFFDLDGTLLDTARDLGGALNRLLESRGHAPKPQSELRSVVSDGALALIQCGFDVSSDDPSVPELRQALLDFYLDDLNTHTRPFDGIESLIEKLAAADLKWGIATNKPWLYTEPLMARYSFASEPCCILCPDHVAKKKPDPESLFLACDSANCSTDEAIYIGDHERDILCGKQAGVKTIAAAYGYVPNGDCPSNWQADYCVEHAEEIWPLLEPLCTNERAH